MNGYAPIYVYRGLWRQVGPRGAERWEKVTSRPGHVVALVLPEYLNTYNARAEYPELSQHLGAPYWAGLWFWDKARGAWQQHRTWSSWGADTGDVGEARPEKWIWPALALGALYVWVST